MEYEVGEYEGEVGEYEGEVGEYEGEVGEYEGLNELFTGTLYNAYNKQSYTKALRRSICSLLLVLDEDAS